MVPSENFLRYSLCSAVIRRTARARSYDDIGSNLGSANRMISAATERSCVTNHTAEAVRGSGEPHSVGGSRPRVAGWPEARPELGDWRLDRSVPER
jgi:hypothetical protein